MKRTYAIIFLMLMAAAASAQRAHIINGSVMKESDRSPIPYATVYRLSTGSYIDCDEMGMFELALFGNDDAVLVATAVGYSTDTAKVDKSVRYVEFHLRPTSELQGAVITGREMDTYFSKNRALKTEVISAAALCKMACCNLSESFENTATVSVGYADAVTGARQIRLLGLSGIYTAMQDENRPTMRGLASPFGLSFIPGQWLESIQIAKGPSSVINSSEAISGQINLEHRKPTDEKPLFANLLLNSELMSEANVASSLQLNSKWSTVLLGHFSTMPMNHDRNGDGFRDEPKSMQVDFDNRWLYYDPTGMQIRFGVKGIYDDRLGGNVNFTKGDEKMAPSEMVRSNLWGSRIKNQNFDAYAKIGYPLDKDNTMSVSGVLDYMHHDFDSNFGIKGYDASQNSLFANAIFQYIPNPVHRVTAGIRNQLDSYNEILTDRIVAEGNITENPINLSRFENTVGVYGEYTYAYKDMLTATGEVSAEYNNRFGTSVSPRLNVRYTPVYWLTIRASGGEGHRSPCVITDNLGMLSTGRSIVIEEPLKMERAWTYGGNVTFDIPIFDDPDRCQLSFDYFRSDFTSQVIADQERLNQNTVSIYNLDGKSYTNTFQTDFTIEPIDRFTITATFRYSDSKITLADLRLVERPLVSRWKNIFNFQYATKMKKWVFDLTFQLNGPARVPRFAATRWGYDESPVYPMLFAQVTRKFKWVEVYVGGENLTNFTQAKYLNTDNVIDASNPFSSTFNASSVWGPLTGIKIYAGARFTLEHEHHHHH